MTIERFEEIRAWQQARELTNLVYDLTEQEKFKKTFGCATKSKELRARSCTTSRKDLMMAPTLSSFIS